MHALFLVLFAGIDGGSLLIRTLDGVVLVGIERSEHTCGLELEVYNVTTGVTLTLTVNWVAVGKVDRTCGGEESWVAPRYELIFVRQNNLQTRSDGKLSWLLVGKETHHGENTGSQ